MFDNYPDVIRPNELSKMLQIGRTKTYTLIKSGILPSKRIGGHYFIRKIDVLKFLENTQQRHHRHGIIYYDFIMP